MKLIEHLAAKREFGPVAEHAIASWVSEGTEACRLINYVTGDKRRALYYRTRAVVMYDRARDELAGVKRSKAGHEAPEGLA